MGHKWAKWLHIPCRLWGPHRFRGREIIKGGPQAGKVATLPLPSGGSLPLHGEVDNQRWPSGHITPAAWGFPISP